MIKMHYLFINIFFLLWCCFKYDLFKIMFQVQNKLSSIDSMFGIILITTANYFAIKFAKKDILHTLQHHYMPVSFCNLWKLNFC